MNFYVVSLFPEIIKSYFSVGVLAQAQKNNLFYIHNINPRQFTVDNHRTVDDSPFGGGDGMLMQAQVLAKSVESIANLKDKYCIYLSPQGRTLTAKKASHFASVRKDLVLICGRYGGVDQRFIQKYVQEEISVGDYVLSGGELPACALIDSITRFLPGVLGSLDSAQMDSFEEGTLEAPQFTRPAIWEGFKVPEVLLSGDHQKIKQWKKNVSRLVTFIKRQDLFKDLSLTVAEKKELVSFFDRLSFAEKEILGISQLKKDELL